MHWQETEEIAPFKVPDDVVDLVFALDGGRIPVDHAQSLAQAVCAVLPERIHATIGIHPVRVAESGNGWERPREPDALLDLSRRTKLVVRTRQQDIDAVARLSGSVLSLDGGELKVGRHKPRKLSSLGTLFSHAVRCEEDAGEPEFLKAVSRELGKMGVVARKLLCGTSQRFDVDGERWLTRSLMVADLPPEESVRLQQHGLGDGRLLGCGLFIPHKGIDPVHSPES